MTALMMMALLIILRLARLTVDPVKVVNTVTDMFGGFILLFTITGVLGGHSGQNGTARYIVTDFLENFKMSKHLKLCA